MAKDPAPPPPTFQELNSKHPDFPALPTTLVPSLAEITRSDIHIVNHIAAGYAAAWKYASPMDVDGVTKLGNATLKLLEFRRRVLMLPLGDPSKKLPKEDDDDAFLYD